MTSQSEDDFRSHLQQQETGVSSPVVVVTQIEPVNETVQAYSGSAMPIVAFLNWFNNLSGIRKLIVTIAGVIFGFAMLQAVLKLIASVLSVVLFAGLAFVGYKFFVASK
jgi:tetrahydromethanopterin S-methyltransferase subunit B